MRLFYPSFIAVASLCTLLMGCSNDKEVGDVSLGWFTTKDVKISVLQDPVVTGVTCHIASIEADLGLCRPQ